MAIDSPSNFRWNSFRFRHYTSRKTTLFKLCEQLNVTETNMDDSRQGRLKYGLIEH